MSKNLNKSFPPLTGPPGPKHAENPINSSRTDFSRPEILGGYGPFQAEKAARENGEALELGAKGHQVGIEKNHRDCMAVGAVSREPFSAKFPI